MNGNFGDTGFIFIRFRDKESESVCYNNVIGYQAGGGALSVSLDTGSNMIFPLDLIEVVQFDLNEKEENGPEGI
jgi:hypothetical protein